MKEDNRDGGRGKADEFERERDRERKRETVKIDGERGESEGPLMFPAATVSWRELKGFVKNA
jgi:hypothetical protein